MKIILFLSLLIWVIPGFGKVKIQKPRSQHVTAFAIIVDEMTLEKTGGAVEATGMLWKQMDCRLILSVETGKIRMR